MIKNIEDILKSFNAWKVARIVVFKDNKIAKKFPEFAVKDRDGNVWKDYKGNAWIEPYNKKYWDYILELSRVCALKGFDEIQYDYIRFPSDGDVKKIKYSVNHTSITARNVLKEFLIFMKDGLKNYDVKISIDVFGLTHRGDLGVGQAFKELADEVDFVCPMVYPSHYYQAFDEIKNPESMPYETVNKSLKEFVSIIATDYIKIRPYLQDFSIKIKYGVDEVKSQIKAVYDNGIKSWTLWSPACNYSIGALTKKDTTTFKP